jgi:hypothetical protein
VVTTDPGNGRLCEFCVGDGRLTASIFVGTRGLRDVEVVDGGWLVACAGTDTIDFVVRGDVPDPDAGTHAAGGGEGGSGSGVDLGPQRPFLGISWEGDLGKDDGELDGPTALAIVPGLGLLVREMYNARVQVGGKSCK